MLWLTIDHGMTTKPPVIFARSVGGLLGADFEPDFFSTRFLFCQVRVYDVVQEHV